MLYIGYLIILDGQSVKKISGGFRALGQGTVAHLLSPLGCSSCQRVGGDVCARCSGPQQWGRGALH